ncbi:MAG: hypothetical protein A2Z91_07465 [Deltaproteobacteria bacterium GWA2_38_16]|nr:MAG: hypothetical protein A2Z91_07465 [Deltaproteobacteria bacterium GWA2_38_16]OGQ02745.1 MAG: hypothetical protein A3D19_00800 [Deltaproteobacteria bacterium RIFCSPHIGHO2_02_FULL_38_15]OGQ31857.1 MAG: hypothetical protein A3A72_02260 [Deltaproteobacteria bacterium RIFCSPLOWO2_01_FULL_38_9]OGQ59071.1 MAG: hypothetical protein A3G92_06100 [Deltaproteobacteria bacterium RIFCSPLOWO2_12_FULL_38_8]HBQ20606.1 hypothetical protein [Deltaproteobacteria bacterium]
MEVNLYQYKDYRNFLKDFYVEKKKTNHSYSYSVFSRKAGLQSPNYLKRVMDGSRNLTHRNLRNFVVGLGLSKKESHYFENLVMFNQSIQSQSKDFYFGELKKISDKNDAAFKIDGAYYEYLSHWYYVAIHEMVNLKDFKEDPEWICQHLKNKITKSQAKHALSFLLSTGLLKREPLKGTKGKLTQVHPKLKYLKDVKNIAIQKFHEQMMDLAKESIDQEDITKREPSSLTLCVTENNYEEIKKFIQEFRAELNDKFSCQPGTGKEVIQINFQLFSLTPKERSQS